jgi:uncharacterized protein YjbJ (UPF0337 family)
MSARKGCAARVRFAGSSLWRDSAVSPPDPTGLAGRGSMRASVRTHFPGLRREGEKGATNMNKDQASGTWDLVKGKAKRIWGELTDDDLMKAEGSVDKLFGIIQKRFGDTKEQIKAKIDGMHIK